MASLIGDSTKIDSDLGLMAQSKLMFELLCLLAEEIQFPMFLLLVPLPQLCSANTKPTIEIVAVKTEAMVSLLVTCLKEKSGKFPFLLLPTSTDILTEELISLESEVIVIAECGSPFPCDFIQNTIFKVSLAFHHCLQRQHNNKSPCFWVAFAFLKEKQKHGVYSKEEYPIFCCL